MTTRRGLFKLLAGALASPALAPLAKLLPERMTEYTTYLAGEDVIQARVVYAYNESFLEHLKRNIGLTAFCKTVDIPPHCGNTIRFFTYTPEAAHEHDLT